MTSSTFFGLFIKILFSIFALLKKVYYEPKIYADIIQEMSYDHSATVRNFSDFTFCS